MNYLKSQFHKKYKSHLNQSTIALQNSLTDLFSIASLSAEALAKAEYTLTSNAQSYNVTLKIKI